MKTSPERGVYAASMSDWGKPAKRHECRAPMHWFGFDEEA